MLPAADDCLLQCQLVSRCNSHVSCVRISCAAETAARTAGGCKSRCAAAPSSRREQAGSCTPNGWPAQCTSINISPVCPMQEQCSSSRANPNVLSLELAGREAVFVRAAGRGGRRCASGGREAGGKGPLGAPACSLLSWCFAVSGCFWGCWAAAPRAGGEGACQRSRSGGRQRRAQPWQEVHTALERGSEPRTEVPVQLRPMPTCRQMASCPTGPFSGRHSTASEPVFLPLTHQQRVQPAGSPPHNGAAVGAL